MSVIGTCSNCDGPVTVPDYWGGAIPPIPTCSRCGAQSATPYGPKIQMERPGFRPDDPRRETQQEYFGKDKK